MTKKSRQKKFKYLENEKSSSDEITAFFVTFEELLSKKINLNLEGKSSTLKFS